MKFSLLVKAERNSSIISHMNHAVGRGRWLSGMAMAGVWALAVSLSLYREMMEDVPWHLKTGQWILAHRAVPQVDFYSFTRAGQEWLDVQWLFQVIAYLFYDFLGEPGITLLTLWLTLIILGVLLAAAPGRIPRGLRALGAVMFLLSLNSRIACRPEHLSALYLALMLFCLERGTRGHTRLLALVPLLQLLWVNTQGIWPLGLAVVGAYLADRLLQAYCRPGAAEKSRLAPWLVVAVLCLAAGMIQPYGWRGLWFPLILIREGIGEGSVQKQSVIELWPLLAKPLAPGVVIPFLVSVAAALVVTAAGGKKLRPGLSLLGLLFLGLALSARRNVGIASVVVFHLLNTHLEILLRRPAVRDRAESLSRLGSVVALAGAVVFTALSLGPKIRTWDQSGRERGVGLSHTWYPRQAAEFLWLVGYRGNLINDDRVAGYLLWVGWPDWKVFSDPRLEVGGPAATELYFRVFQDPFTFQEIAARHQVEAVLIYHPWPFLRQFLRRLLADPDWAVVYLDADYAVCLRRSARWQNVISQTEIPPAQAFPRLPPPISP